MPSPSTTKRTPSVQVVALDKLHDLKQQTVKPLLGVPPKEVLAVGAFGDLFTRFLGKATKDLATYLPHRISYIPVDLAPEKNPERFRELVGTGINLSSQVDYLPAKEAKLRIADGRLQDVAGAFLAIPTLHHLAEAKHYSELGIRVGIEKPLGIPGEEKTFHKIFSEHRRIMPLDFAFGSLPICHFVHTAQVRDLLSKLGTLSTVHVRLIENTPIAKGREWLFERSISGGGACLDLAPHTIGIAERMLKELGSGHSFSDYSLDRVIRGRYTLIDIQTGDRVPCPGDCESYMRIIGKLHSASNPVELRMDLGRIGERTYYGITLEGTTGELEISFGLDGEFNTPYIRFDDFRNNERTLFTIPHDFFGYEILLMDWTSFALGSETFIGPSLQDRHTMAELSLSFTTAAEELAEPTILHQFEDISSLEATGCPRPKGLAMDFQSLMRL